MKSKRALLVVGLAVLAAFVFAAGARADVYMKQKTHTGAFKMMGQSQPEKDEIMVFWLSGQKARTDLANGTSMLFYGDKGVLYALDHAKKQYTEIPMNIDKMFDEAMGEGEDAAESKKMAEMMKGMAKGMMGQMKITVTETPETKKIGAWNCRKYLIDMDMGMGQSKAEAWATADLKIDYNLFFAVSNAMMAQMPGFDKLAQEMKKVKGVVVLQTAVTKMMGSEVTTTTELIEYAEKGAPAGTYDIPAGYAKVKGMKMGR